MTTARGQRMGGRRPPEPTSTRTDPPEPTAPEAPEEAPASNGQAVRPARPARTAKPAQAPAEMDKARRLRWRTTLQNAALKLAADRARLDESEQAWADTVAEARALGVPANVIVAAAAYADVELPE